MRKTLCAMLVGSFALTGCYSFQGPRPVLDRGSVNHYDIDGQRSGYLYERFRRATLIASGCGNTEPAEDLRDVEAINQICEPDEADPTAIKTFMNAGYELIYADCSAYFAHMGRNQGRSRLARDVIAPIGTLITGIVSIVRFEDTQTRDDLLGSLALFTTAGTAGLNVYDKNFLFGSDNIEAVRTLVQRALKTHAAETFNTTHATFGQAANHLDDNQAICRPSHILVLARQAISGGKIMTTSSSVPPADGVAPAGPAAPAPIAPPAGNGAPETVSVSVPQ